MFDVRKTLKNGNENTLRKGSCHEKRYDVAVMQSDKVHSMLEINILQQNETKI